MKFDESLVEKVKVCLEGRCTNLGAYTKYYVFTEKGEFIEPALTEESRTGNHWTDIYFLSPGTYYIYFVDITNCGKHNCGFGVIKVSKEKAEIVHHAKIPRKIVKKMKEVIEFCECTRV